MTGFVAATILLLLQTDPAIPAGRGPDQLNEACARGAGEPCRALAILYHDGTGVTRDFLRARELFERGCSAGDAKSCLRLAEMISMRRGVGKDPPLPALYLKACEGGELQGCLWLGRSYLEPPKGAKAAKTEDATRGLALFERACSGCPLEASSPAPGSPSACTALGEMLLQGKTVTKDAGRGLTYLEKACDAGDPGACVRLGLTYDEGKEVGRDPARAAEFYRRNLALLQRSCDTGDALDCKRLGKLHREGVTGAALDAQKSVRFYERTCDLGDAYGCSDLALMYAGRLGSLLPRDPTRAAEMYGKEAAIRNSLCDAGDFRECYLANSTRADNKACDRGDPDGCFRVAKIYLYMNHGLKDAARAVHFLGRGCELGDIDQCEQAAVMYSTEKDLAPERSQAVRLYEKACGAGGALACLALGDRLAASRKAARAAEFYEKACELSAPACVRFADALRDGKGVARDPASAAMLYRKACESSGPTACASLGVLYRDGIGVPVDKPQAAKLFRDVCISVRALGYPPPRSCADGCAMGDARACYELGLSFADTDGSRALPLLEKACTGSQAEACAVAASLLEEGAPHLGRDKARAAALRRREHELAEEKRP